MANQSQTNNVVRLCKEFCSESTVHGVRYLIDSKIHWMERLWWAISFTLSVISCVFAVSLIWMKWTKHPVTVTFDDKITSIGMIPYPAITICTTQKFKENISVSELPLYFPDQVFEDDVNKLNAILQLCFEPVAPPDEKNFVSLNRSIYETLIGTSPNMSTVIDSAQVINKNQRIRFKPIFTKEGLCFTYNSINSQEIYSDEVASELLTVRGNPRAAHWDAEDGYRSNVNESELYPYRVFGAGLEDSLQIKSRINLDESYAMCGFPAPGVLLSVHSPDELPQFLNDYTFIRTDHAAFISIKPKMMATSDGLRSYAPHERGCFYNSERRLRFFKSYSQHKCELECLTNFTRAECACVRFWMPRDEITQVCRSLEIDCYKKAERNFMHTLMMKQCDCLPDCTSLSYDEETSQVPMYFTKTDREDREDHPNSGFSTCSISFKENHFISMIRSETSTLADFIASCGGLFGFFMGVSMLSVVELIYFFTLRLCCALRRQNGIQPNQPAWNGRNQFEIHTVERRRRQSH